MWEAEAYYIAVLIILGSAVWPYVKMLLMIGAWFVPVERAGRGQGRRGTVARALDLLGKWSLIDGFVMILLQVGFGFTISILTITVDVEVTTEWAVTGGMLASTWSALQSHLLLLAHHRAAGPAAEPTKPRRAVPPKRSLAAIVLVFACSMGAVGVGAYGATQQNTTSYTYGGFAVRIPPLPAGRSCAAWGCSPDGATGVGSAQGPLVQQEPPSLTLIELGQRFFEDGVAGTSNLAGIWIVTGGYFAFTLMLPPLQLCTACAHVATAGRGWGRAPGLSRAIGGPDPTPPDVLPISHRWRLSLSDPAGVAPQGRCSPRGARWTSSCWPASRPCWSWER